MLKYNLEDFLAAKKSLSSILNKIQNAIISLEENKLLEKILKPKLRYQKRESKL